MTMTAHARLRMKERGISASEIETLLTWGNEVSVGGGSRSIMLSRRIAAELVAEGTPQSQIDSLKRTAIVVASNGKIVTTMRIWGSVRARHYRHGI